MRKIVDINNCTEIGYVKKTHGVRGELLLNFEDGIDVILEDAEYLFLEVEGLLVPFFIEETSIHNGVSGAILFDTLNTKEKATRFVGCKVFIDNGSMIHDSEFFNIQLIKGFTVSHVERGVIGKVTAIDDFGGNFVISVDYNGKEVLLPFNEELLEEFDEEMKSITMFFPEELLIINE